MWHIYSGPPVINTAAFRRAFPESCTAKATMGHLPKLSKRSLWIILLLCLKLTDAALNSTASGTITLPTKPTPAPETFGTATSPSETSGTAESPSETSGTGEPASETPVAVTSSSETGAPAAATSGARTSSPAAPGATTLPPAASSMGTSSSAKSGTATPGPAATGMGTSPSGSTVSTPSANVTMDYGTTGLTLSPNTTTENGKEAEGLPAWAIILVSLSAVLGIILVVFLSCMICYSLRAESYSTQTLPVYRTHSFFQSFRNRW